MHGQYPAMLSAAPLDVKVEPWWGVQVVNVGEHNVMPYSAI
jgi:hypothetical protein